MTWSFERFAPGAGDDAEFERVRERVYGDGSREPVDPRATCVLCRRGGEAVARCTTQIVADLNGAPGRSGLIGHYETVVPEAGIALLVDARDALAGAGVTRVLGPMNGSTWARYRLALPAVPGDPAFAHPMFLGEPRNPFDYPEHFEGAGFTVAARYESRADRRLGEAEPPTGVPTDALSRRISIRSLDLTRFDDELRELFDMSLEAFADNLYYTPIDFESFRLANQRLRPILDPDFVLLAHDADGRLVAYQLTYPDPLSVEDGRPTRIVVKTVATRPEARGKGLGQHLLDRIRAQAHHRGYREVVHALMHVANFSMRMSARHSSEIFRRYALYQWTP